MEKRRRNYRFLNPGLFLAAGLAAAPFSRPAQAQAPLADTCVRSAVLAEGVNITSEDTYVLEGQQGDLQVRVNGRPGHNAMVTVIDPAAGVMPSITASGSFGMNSDSSAFAPARNVTTFSVDSNGVTADETGGANTAHAAGTIMRRVKSCFTHKP